jgi:glycosyltransferase involved in cell wall biosynthesis
MRSSVGYVLKVYPRFSETFIVHEVLAHERAGLALHLFSLRPPVEGRFHEMLARVRAPVSYLPSGALRADRLWRDLADAAAVLPGLFAALDELRDQTADDLHQGVLLAREVRLRGITHLHAHFGTVAAGVARIAARLAGVPYSFTAHAKDIFWDGVDEAALRSRIADAAAVVTVSDFNAARLRALHQRAAGRIHRIYNGIDLERFRFREPDERPPLIAAVGRLVEKKGFVDLIDACALLAAAGMAFSCRIAGAGPLADGLRARIDAAGLESRVELIGPRSHDEVRALVEEAAVLAAPCRVAVNGDRDGLPTVLLEAMALGTPCVSTPVTGIPEAIRHGRTGLLVAERDPAALAAALADLLVDAGLRARLARAARALVERRFDVDRNAAEMRSLLWPAAVAATVGA